MPKPSETSEFIRDTFVSNSYVQTAWYFVQKSIMLQNAQSDVLMLVICDVFELKFQNATESPFHNPIARDTVNKRK